MQPQSWVTSDIYSGPSQPKCWRECRLQDLLSRRQWTAGRFWRVHEAFPQVTIHHAPWPAASPWGPTADREVQLCTLLFLAMSVVAISSSECSCVQIRPLPRGSGSEMHSLTCALCTQSCLPKSRESPLLWAQGSRHWSRRCWALVSKDLNVFLQVSFWRLLPNVPTIGR